MAQEMEKRINEVCIRILACPEVSFICTCDSWMWPSPPFPMYRIRRWGLWVQTVWDFIITLLIWGAFTGRVVFL